VLKWIGGIIATVIATVLGYYLTTGLAQSQPNKTTGGQGTTVSSGAGQNRTVGGAIRPVGGGFHSAGGGSHGGHR
jgi:hypothetical protein